mmetsp:Transcript_24041/g.30652  ORF Transcript_24041/g.30652 Transcript_24041/m.30652 type:complete len:84 (-) Transcript_24041:47-298(-)
MRVLHFVPINSKNKKRIPTKEGTINTFSNDGNDDADNAILSCFGIFLYHARTNKYHTKNQKNPSITERFQTIIITATPPHDSK